VIATAANPSWCQVLIAFVSPKTCQRLAKTSACADMQ
jgi:hypothetical protein